jgi:hypothetical protein
LRATAKGREKGAHAAAHTVEAVGRQFVERHCLRKNRASTAPRLQRMLKLHVLPRWGKRLFSDITRGMCATCSMASLGR